MSTLQSRKDEPDVDAGREEQGLRHHRPLDDTVTTRCHRGAMTDRVWDGPLTRSLVCV